MTQADPRHLTTKAAEHALEGARDRIDDPYAGLPGGPTEEYLDAEEKRLAADPIGVQDVDLTYNAIPDTVNHEVDTSALHPMEVPRHDRYADENTPEPTPDRVIPGGVTNAHPDFSVSDTGEVGPGHQGLTTTGDLSTASGGKDALAEVELPTDGELPAGNASAETWRAYAIAQGMAPDAAELMTRNELRDLYSGVE